jgi:hypothetical protein
MIFMCVGCICLQTDEIEALLRKRLFSFINYSRICLLTILATCVKISVNFQPKQHSFYFPGKPGYN